MYIYIYIERERERAQGSPVPPEFRTRFSSPASKVRALSPPVPHPPRVPTSYYYYSYYEHHY